MVYNLLNDLKTLIDAHDFTVNGDLSADPLVFVERDELPTNYPQANGFIMITDESLNSREMLGQKYDDLHYRVNCIIKFAAQSTDAKLKAVMEEMKSAFDTNNEVVTRSWDHQILYVWDSSVRDGQIDLIIESIELGVVKSV